MCDMKDHSSIFILFFLIQICVILTGFTGFLKQFKVRDKLICHRYLREKARAIFQVIKMGGLSSKQDVKGDNSVNEMVGMESNYSLLDL